MMMMNKYIFINFVFVLSLCSSYGLTTRRLNDNNNNNNKTSYGLTTRRLNDNNNKTSYGLTTRRLNDNKNDNNNNKTSYGLTTRRLNDNKNDNKNDDGNINKFGILIDTVTFDDLFADKCYPCYTAYYSDPTTYTKILSCAGPVLFVGAILDGESVFSLGAYGLASEVQTQTAINTPHLSNGVYWYFTPQWSFGFL